MGATFLTVLREMMILSCAKNKTKAIDLVVI